MQPSETGARTEVLRRSDLRPDPIEQLEIWMETAERTESDPNAVSLATASADGAPSARMVIVNSFDAAGFVFHTDVRSQKARQLAENPQAALVFFWPLLRRQVRVTGRVEALPRPAVEAYFHERPREHQLAVWAVRQSERVASRIELESRLADLEARYEGRAVDLPPYWVGYRLVPDEIELWEQASDRLHDRFQYTRAADDTWHLVRLAP